jgi:predicted PolB exonuclease-like 3'-5' exonuclease
VFKSIGDCIWTFDLEWVPDPEAGRRIYRLPVELTDAEVLSEMWKRGGASEAEPQPYLKTVLCRVVSIAVVVRKKKSDGTIKLDLASLPKPPDRPQPEQELLCTFLSALGKARPQLVGFNSAGCDLPILIQRGIAKGITAPEFCKRPDRPWEGSDYFIRWGDDHVDLKDVVCGSGRAAFPSLHELAEVSGIPGKIDTAGKDVVALWSKGSIKQIVEYNEFDALTTYLVWLRVAHFGGFLSPEQYRHEESLVFALLRSRTEGGDSYFTPYLDRWKQLRDGPWFD